MYPFDLRQIMRLLARLDKLSFLVMLLLLGMGLLFIRCAGMEYHSVNFPTRWLIQAVFIGIGMVLYFACALADYRQLGRYSWLIFIVGLMLLSMVFVSGGKDFGARSVLRLPGMAVQVSEPMKAAALLFIAWVLSHPLLRFSNISPLVIWGAIISLPFGIIALQHDMGTGLQFLPFSFAILFVNGLKKRWLLIIAIVIACCLPFVYLVLKPYQKQRIVVFVKEPCEMAIFAVGSLLGEEREAQMQKSFDAVYAQMKDSIRDKDGNRIEPDNWNAEQSLRTVAVGGLHGVGYTEGRQHTLGYLPRTVASTDFIFAVLCEESGLLGALVAIFLFVVYITLTFRTAFRANDDFGASIAIGAAVLVASHCIINMGMCIGLSPIIGIPLPFVSYGGSCLLGMLLVAGLVQSVHIHTIVKPKE
ncbi:MAG: rod shape-determining protein RodA [Victivallales bacterium]|nr:rod shape-determining protein RodA [Victivallales bacterium]